jgi:histone deacetylase complex regulatory component SIN3
VLKIEVEDRTSDEYIKANLKRIALLQEESNKQMKSNEELNSLVSGNEEGYSFMYVYMHICTSVYTYGYVCSTCMRIA